MIRAGLCFFVFPASATGAAEDRQTSILHSSSFNDGTAPGCKYYDSSLDFRDPLVSSAFTDEDSNKAISGEGNASTQSVTQMLRSLSLSFPIRDDVFVQFAFYLEAEQDAHDQVRLNMEGHGPDGSNIHHSVAVASEPALND